MSSLVPFATLNSEVEHAVTLGGTYVEPILRRVDEQVYARQLLSLGHPELDAILGLRRRLREALDLPSYPPALELLQQALSTSDAVRSAILWVVLSPAPQVWELTGPRALRATLQPGESRPESEFRLLAVHGSPPILQHTQLNAGAVFPMDFVDDFEQGVDPLVTARLVLSHVVRILPSNGRRGARMLFVPPPLQNVPPSVDV